MRGGVGGGRHGRDGGGAGVGGRPALPPRAHRWTPSARGGRFTRRPLTIGLWATVAAGRARAWQAGRGSGCAPPARYICRIVWALKGHLMGWNTPAPGWVGRSKRLAHGFCQVSHRRDQRGGARSPFRGVSYVGRSAGTAGSKADTHGGYAESTLYVPLPCPMVLMQLE